MTGHKEATALRPPAHNAVIVRSVLAVTAQDREKILEDVEYNIFAFPAGLLTCDFLSDSGTSAMLDVQWAACESTLFLSISSKSSSNVFSVVRLKRY
jgi:tryptophanase